MNAQTATVERPAQAVAEFTPPASRGNIVPMPPQPVMKAYPPKIAKSLMAITREFGPITKDGWNDFHKYHYQKWEDVLERESNLLGQHGIIIQQSEVARTLLDKVISITYEFSIINEDGDCWPDRPVFTAIGRLQDNKGIFDDKAANKCHTQAHKYFLLHTFKIRTKEAAEDDADAAVGQTGDAAATRSTPKPPRPGSAEAKAAEAPRTIDIRGHNPQSFADAFIKIIETAESSALDQWLDLNKTNLDKLAKYESEIERVTAAIAKRRPAQVAQPTPPRPPKPGSNTLPANPMPDPETDADGFVRWLTGKLEAFATYDEGERFWNERIEPLDLADTVQEDAMGCWRQFEARFEP